MMWKGDYMKNTTRMILLTAAVVLAAGFTACEDLFDSSEDLAGTEEQLAPGAGSQTWSYTVTWDLNGGDGDPPPPKTVKSPARMVAQFPPEPSRSGYEFRGWYTAPAGGSAFTRFTILSSDMTVYAQWWETEKLQLHYLFNGAGNGIVNDESGNGFALTLKDGASVRSIDDYRFLDTGNNGWADMGAETGFLTSRLNNFTIAFYVYIPEDTAITGAGNMIVSFSNSDNLGTHANGAMYIQAKNDRLGFTLGPQHWTGEQSVRGTD